MDSLLDRNYTLPYRVGLRNCSTSTTQIWKFQQLVIENIGGMMIRPSISLEDVYLSYSLDIVARKLIILLVD